MKFSLNTLCFIMMTGVLHAHDHIETRLDPINPSRLGLVGDTSQTATYFPFGESPNIYDLPLFPGGFYASQLTFSAFDNAAPPANGALVRIEILAVTGPAGGSVSFWDTFESSPAITRASGWVAGISDQPAIDVSEDESGYGHIHGRVFTMNKPGVYQVTFRAMDTTGEYDPSLPFVVEFTALATPQLSIRFDGGMISLTFESRSDLVYDVQSTTTLDWDDWTTINTLDGNGQLIEFEDPLAGRPRVFYRLVEYQ